MKSLTVDEILLPGKIKKCLLDEGFVEYEYKKHSGFQVRVFKQDGVVSVRVIYRISGRGETGYYGNQKRNAKIKKLRAYTEVLMAHGYWLSPGYKSNGRASYFSRNPALLRDRQASFRNLKIHSLLAADGQDLTDLANLYLVTSFWYGKLRPEFRMRSMRYGVELQDTYTPMEAANYGYRVIGTLSNRMVNNMHEWWEKAGQGRPDLQLADLKMRAKLQMEKKTYKQWKATKAIRASKKTLIEWRASK